MHRINDKGMEASGLITSVATSLVWSQSININEQN